MLYNKVQFIADGRQMTASDRGTMPSTKFKLFSVFNKLKTTDSHESKPGLQFFYNQRNLYMIGFLLAFTVTFLEFIRGRHHNFIVFSEATQYFWQGISPYTTEFIESYGRFFLYSPTFTVLFAPFAYLPAWLGPFVWNLFNYTLFFISIFTLPQQFTHQQKCRMFLFLLPILGQSLLSFQYNITVAYIFLFSYTLFEKDRGFLAVLLIMISGCTKIYGIFELALLFCYPHFWRNIGYVLGTGIVLLALPLLKLAPMEFLPYHGEWLQILTVHQSTGVYDSFFYAQPITKWALPHFRMLQLGMLGVLALLFLGNYRKWTSSTFRAQALGILMCWVVLLSDSAEKHTYVIALAGFMLWYWSRENRTMTDKILFWSCFVLLCIVPIDVIVPVPIRNIITRVLWINIWVFFITWIRMIWQTFLYPQKKNLPESPKL